MRGECQRRDKDHPDTCSSSSSPEVTMASVLVSALSVILSLSLILYSSPAGTSCFLPSSISVLHKRTVNGIYVFIYFSCISSDPLYVIADVSHNSTILLSNLLIII